jgi:hypothetical protein
MRGDFVIAPGSRRVDWVLVSLLLVSVCITCLTALGVAFLVTLV